MNLRWRPATAAMMCMILALTGLAVLAPRALAEDCVGGFVRGSIVGEGSRVKLGLEGQTTGCGSSSIQKIIHEPQPYFTYEVSCSTDRQRRLKGCALQLPVQTLDGSLLFELFIVLMGVASRRGSPV
jgi:hypothetical protein